MTDMKKALRQAGSTSVQTAGEITDLSRVLDVPANPAVEARMIVRNNMRDIRIAIGETTAEAEDYTPKHARMSAR